MMMTLEELMARFNRKEGSLRRDLWRFNLLPKVEVDDDGQWVQRWDENVVRQIYECGGDVLTPLECERLMGFPDNWTRISWRGKPPEECPDGHRYKCCGNSMCVNVMRWIGKRIQQVEDKGNEGKSEN